MPEPIPPHEGPGADGPGPGPRVRRGAGPADERRRARRPGTDGSPPGRGTDDGRAPADRPVRGRRPGDPGSRPAPRREPRARPDVRDAADGRDPAHARSRREPGRETGPRRTGTARPADRPERSGGRTHSGEQTPSTGATAAAGHGHGHGHGHEPAAPASRRVRTLLISLLAPFALAALAGVVLLYPWGEPDVSGYAVGEPVHGDVISSELGPCLSPGQVQVGDPGQGGPCQQIEIRLTDGPADGRTITQSLPAGQGNPRFAAGDAVVLSYSGADAQAGSSYQVQDFQRSLPLALLAGLFALAVVVLGRWRGVAALGALAVTAVIIGLFVLPSILHGGDPLLVAIAGAGLIMFVALYTTHGFSARTSAAVLGTMVSLSLIGLIAAVFAGAARLTGLDESTSTLIGSLGHGIDARGLLLAGIVIGALGVLDDVTVTQASAVWELHRVNPRQSWRELYGAALRIGRAHVGSAVNTLVMAYAGAALPALLLASLSDVGLGSILTSQELASEIVRTLAGSIGIIAAVPVTTLLAAVIVVREENPVVPAADDRADSPAPCPADPADAGRADVGDESGDPPGDGATAADVAEGRGAPPRRITPATRRTDSPPPS
nr:YibE/F family protein [Prauserella isguenensis]